MAFMDQNQRAAANPVHPGRYQQFLELREWVKKLQKRVKALEDEKEATDNG